MKRTALLAAAVLVTFQAFAGNLPEPILENFTGEFIRSINKVEGVPDKRVNALVYEDGLLYCGAASTLYILDTRKDPLHPVIRSKATISGLIRQMCIQDGYLFAACRESGVWIFNVKDPDRAEVVTRYDPVELATGIDVAGNVLFLGTRQNGVECVDISDIHHPTHIRMEKTDESQSVFYRDGLLYSGEWGGHCVTTIDARDLSTLKILGKSDLKGYGDGIWTYKNYLYASTGHNLIDKANGKGQLQGKGHGLEIFDISDPVHPRHLSRVGFDEIYIRAVDYWTPRPCSEGRYVICADTFNGLYVVDAENPEELRTVSRLHFTRADGKPEAVSSTAVGKGVVYVSVFNGYGLLALECPEAAPCERTKGRLPVNADYRYPYETPASSHFRAWKPQTYSPVRGLATYGKHLFVACSYGGLAIVDADRKGNATQVGSGPMKYAGDVKVRGDRLYVAEGPDGLGVYRIGKDLTLTEEARFNDFSKSGMDVCLWVWVPDEKYIVASTRLAHYYLDTTSYPELKLAGRLSAGAGWDKYLSNGSDSKGWYPSTRHKSAVLWVNLKEDKLKETKDKGLIPTLNDGVCRFRGDKFLCCHDGKIYVFGSDSIGEEKEGFGKGFRGLPAWDGKNTLVLTNRMKKKVSLVDISDEKNPQLLWTEDCCGYPETAVFWNGKLAVPCGYQGLLLQK